MPHNDDKSVIKGNDVDVSPNRKESGAVDFDYRIRFDMKMMLYDMCLDLTSGQKLTEAGF